MRARGPGCMPCRVVQRGQAVLFSLMLIGIMTGLFVYSMVDIEAITVQRDQNTGAALAQAKEGLIGRAVADDNRPGSLPCPDTDNDGSAEILAGGNCPSYIGRLPFRTLGLPDLRDDAGERLWYALSNRFRDDNSAQPLNSDAKGNRTVHDGTTAITITAEAVAVIFAPGTSLPGQTRDAVAALCPTTGTTIARNQCAANYLEATGGANNATLAGPYITAPRSTTFNDRLLILTTADLMPPVERRVVREMLKLLADPVTGYRAMSACACYPWAANEFDDDSVNGRTRGMTPIENALPEAWGSGGIPSVPSWINNNEWGKVFYYAVAPLETATHLPATTLTVDIASKNLVLITTGPAGATRPSAVLANYVDDAENNNNDDIFQTPSSTAYARDRIYTLP